MKCPACAEKIPADSEICPFCNTNVEEFEAVPKRGRRKKGGSSGAAGAGFGIAAILGFVCVGLLLCSGVLVALLLPAVQQAREAARRAQCRNNMKQLTLALHNYHDMYGTFPPAVTYGPDGKPMHSWRVLILPYLDQAPLFNLYRMDEPWDGPNNSQLQSMMPVIYSCPSSPAGNIGGFTHYAGLSGPNTLFSKQGPVGISKILDGTSNTLMFVETEGSNIPWTQPLDIDVSTGIPVGPGGLHSDHTGGFHAALADGSVIFISNSINPPTLQGLSTINGGEAVSPY